MAFIHHRSCECVKTELDLFSLPPTQTSIESGKWVQYKPISSLTDNAPIEFVVPGHGDEYLDLSNTMLTVTASITKADGTKFTAKDKNVGPVNNWLHSLFSQVDVYLNGKLVSPQTNTYAYRAYLETLLNYGKDAKESHLTCCLWEADTASEMDNTEEANIGLKNRRVYTDASISADMVGHLHIDLCNQNKYLMNGVELRLRLVRSRDVFSIMSTTTECKVHVSDVGLMVRRCKISPSVLLAHSKTLEGTTAKYPITRVDVKTFTLPAGIQSKTLDNVFLGQLPKRVIIGFVTNTAFNGGSKLNPFNFQHFNMNYFSLYVDGEQVPSKPLQPKFSSPEESVLNFHTLFTGTGIVFSDAGNGIDRISYPHGYCLLAFDLTPDLASSATTHWNLVRNGSLRLDVGFSEALGETVNCLVFAEFDNVIEVDRQRNVSTDYGS